MGEVAEPLLTNWQRVSIVDIDDHRLLGKWIVYDSLGVLDDTAVEVVLWEDFVECWWHDTLGIRTDQNSGDQSLHELLLVDVNASPGSGLDECVVVLGTNQHSRQEGYLFAKGAH